MKENDETLLVGQQVVTPFSEDVLNIINKLPLIYKPWQWFLFKGINFLGRGMMSIFLISMGVSGYMSLQGHRTALFEYEALPILILITLLFIAGGIIEYFSKRILNRKIIKYRFLIKRLFFSLKNKNYEDTSYAKIINSIRILYQADQNYYFSKLLSYSLLAENANLNSKYRATINHASQVIGYCKILLLKFKFRVPLLYYLLARAYLLKNDKNNAIISYNAYLSLEPKDIETANLVSSLSHNKDLH